jgi:hypothetical protein
VRDQCAMSETEVRMDGRSVRGRNEDGEYIKISYS